jgi:hypothetical protein
MVAMAIENRGGDILLTRADRRSRAWATCKVKGSFFSRASREGTRACVTEREAGDGSRR